MTAEPIQRFIASERVHGQPDGVLRGDGRLDVLDGAPLLDQSVRPDDAAAGLGPSQLLEGGEGAVTEEVVLERVLLAPVGLVKTMGSGRRREKGERRREKGFTGNEGKGRKTKREAPRESGGGRERREEQRRRTTTTTKRKLTCVVGESALIPKTA